MSVFGTYIGRGAWPPTRARPGGVTALAILAGLAALATVVALLTLAFRPALVLDRMTMGLPFAVAAEARWPVALASGVAYLAAYAVLAWGLWTAWRRAWTLALIVLAFTIAMDAALLMAGKAPVSQVIGIAIAGAVALYLVRPDVKRYFGVA